MGGRTWAYFFLLLLLLNIMFTVGQALEVTEDDEDGADGADVDVDDDDDFDDDAADEEDDSSKQTRYITSVMFPKYGDGPIPAGEPIDVLATMSTPYSRSGFVIGIRGQIASPFDARKTLQNFSLMWYNETVEANSESSFWYRFYVANDVEPRAYVTTLEMFFLDANNATRIDQLMNRTITITSAPTTFDVKTLTSYVMFMALVVGLGYTAYNLSLGRKARGSGPAVVMPNQVAAADEADEDDFAPLSVRAWKESKDARASGKKGSSKRR